MTPSNAWFEGVSLRPCACIKKLHKLNSFHPTLKFAVDKFEDGIVHYLDIKIVDNETDIYHKDTHTGNICIWIPLPHGV